MKLIDIEKFLRQKIGSLFPIDIEKEKVFRSALDRIQDHKLWGKKSHNTVAHHEYNIEIYFNGISKPRELYFPFRWKAHFREHIKIIMRNHEVENLSFMNDVIGRKYIYQRSMSNYANKSEEVQMWLKENAISNQYVIHDHWLYISDEIVATGFKLTFD